MMNWLKSSWLPGAMHRRIVRNLDTKQLLAFNRWNFVLRMMTLLVFLCVILGMGHPSIGLCEPEPHGFVLWFLVVLCLPMLPLISLANLCTTGLWGFSLEPIFLQYQFGTLGTVALIEMLILLVLGRLLLTGFRKTDFLLDLASDTAWMVFGYGIISILSFGAMFVWGHGGFSIYCK